MDLFFGNDISQRSVGLTMGQTSSDRVIGSVTIRIDYHDTHMIHIHYGGDIHCDKETGIASKLEKSSNRLRGRVSTIVVVQEGIDVINEPDTRHDCIFLNGGNFRIDGLSKESVKALFVEFLGKDRAAEALDHIEQECPDLWPLLKIPVFLRYTAIAFASWDVWSKPKTMSGILIKYFENLARSPHVYAHNIEDILRKLMPMCFNAVREAKVQFTPEDLERAGVSNRDVTDLGTVLLQHGASSPIVGKLVHDDHFYIHFHHQTLQECLAALEALSVNERKFNDSILKEVQEENFTGVLRFMCGILFNDEVLEAASNFVKISDVEVKRRALLFHFSEKLTAAMENSVSHGLIEVLIFLREANGGRPHAAVDVLIHTAMDQQSVNVEGRLLTLRDTKILGWAVSLLSNLKEVKLSSCGLDGEKMENLHHAMQMNQSIQTKIVKFCVRNNRGLGKSGMCIVGKTTNDFKVEGLGIQSCDVEDDHITALKEGAGDHKLMEVDASDNRGIKGLGFQIIASMMGKDGSLKLADCGFKQNDDAARLLAGLLSGPETPELRELILRDDSGPEFAAAIFALISYVKTTFDIRGWKITATQFQQIQEILAKISEQSRPVVMCDWDCQSSSTALNVEPEENLRQPSEETTPSTSVEALQNILERLKQLIRKIMPSQSGGAVYNNCTFANTINASKAVLGKVEGTTHNEHNELHVNPNKTKCNNCASVN